ncbi:MAG: hypothetical protein IKS15_05685 [Opitutales bacterium]|nr:hypothetical protein [Opitutales bacterium]
MPNQRSKKRKSTSITIDVGLLKLLKSEAAKSRTNVSNLLEKIAKEKYNIKDENEKQK